MDGLAEQLALVAAELVKRHGNRFQLGPLSLRLGTGVTCLVGANGAGKSTFFRLAAGIDRPTSGHVALQSNGRVGSMGYLPQELELPRTASCEQFLHYVAWLYRVPKPEREQAVARALERTALSDRAGSKIRELSGGMRRRLGVAHALVHDPAVVLLDEPSAGLDPRQRALLRETITANAEGRVVLVATHLVEDILGMADRVVVIRGGELVFDGDLLELERHDDTVVPGRSPAERAVVSLIGVSE